MSGRRTKSWRGVLYNGCVVGALVVGVLLHLAAPAVASGDEMPGTFLGADFVVTCAFSHRLADDPIAHYGQPGASHSHDFWGNTSTNAFSTYDSLQSSSTTCNRRPDLAAYWMPTVLQADGRPLEPGAASLYYRAVGDPETVVPFPPNFRMLAGDSHATAPQPLTETEWGCAQEGAKRPWQADIPTCPAGTQLAFRVNFPDCWNGRDVDSLDHRSHVAYRRPNGRCPDGYGVSLPKLAMTVQYAEAVTGPVTLSSGSPYSGHADFLNAWDQATLADLTAGCLNRIRLCRQFSGPGGGLDPTTAAATAAAGGAGPATRVDSPSVTGGAFAQSAATSIDGRFVAYESYGAGGATIWRYDRRTGATVSVTRGSAGAAPNGSSFDPSISDDGRFVAYRSSASNLVPGDENQHTDVFVTDLAKGTTTLESVGVGGAAADGDSYSPSLSADGSKLAFASAAGNLVARDANGRVDVFVRDRAAHATGRASVARDGGDPDQASMSPAISADGDSVAFTSRADNLVSGIRTEYWDIFVRRISTATTTLVTVSYAGKKADSSSYSPAISGDGSVVAFESSATNLVRHDNGSRDVFVRDLRSGSITLLSPHLDRSSHGDATDATISRDGRYVAFAAWDPSIVAGDRNGTQDVFVRDRGTGATRRVSLGAGGAETDDASSYPVITPDATAMVFESAATNVGGGSAPGELGLYETAL